MAYNPDLAIDVQNVYAEVSHGKRLPRFAARMLHRYLRLDLINSLIVKGNDGQAFLEQCVEDLDVHPVFEGLDTLQIDPSAKYTFVSNHPLGGIDGVILASRIGQLFPDSRLLFQVNSFLMYIPGIRSVSISINKMGAQSRDLSRQINELYSSNDHLLVFPAGMCSRKVNGKIQDLEWKKTVVAKSVENGRIIIPVHFIGQNSRRFYNVARICEGLKLKFNFAMTLLPDEIYRGMHKTYRIVVGQPIQPEFFDKSKTPFQWAQWLREEVYKLN